MNISVIVVDFGSQYTQLIARRVRELNIYCEIRSCLDLGNIPESVKAIILSGSPMSVKDDQALRIDLSVLESCPVLGICYGAQLIAEDLGGKVAHSTHREYGKSNLVILKPDPFLEGIWDDSQVWMSHGDSIIEIPPGYELLAATSNIPVAVFRSEKGQKDHPIYGIQFHPEVVHTEQGSEILENFLVNICGVETNWTPASFVDETIEFIRRTVGRDHVLMALSGGIDSTVGAMLMHRAIGERLVCFFVDNGLLRKGEYEGVLHGYQGLGLNIEGVNARRRFWDALKGVVDPEEKRKIIGNMFIRIFEEEAGAHPEVKWLGQGTIYPDVIESVSVHGPSATIKSHHNVGGLPEHFNLKLIEPLRFLFKDEVRKVGLELRLPKAFIGRHPFPGPGLAIRILGDVTEEKVLLLQEVDDIYIHYLKKYDLYDKVWQAGAILLPIQSVGVMGDERTYEKTIALRAVSSTDGMTAEWSRLPHEFLAEVSSAIINRVKGVNRVVYDISTKPPSTIEWE